MPDDRPQTPLICSPFLEKNQSSLAEVLTSVTANTPISLRRRQEVCSSLRSLARLLGQPLEAIPAHHRWLRERLKNLYPEQAGMSRKRFANIKSDLRFALEHAGIGRSRRTYLASLTPAWQELWDRINDDRLRWPLSRLLRFCSAIGIGPESVDVAGAAVFRTALHDESFIRQPEQSFRRAVRAWNTAVERVPGWPQVRLSLPPGRRKGWTLPLDAFPASFREDIEAWIGRLRGDDLLAVDAPIRALRPATLKHRQFQTRMFGSALVHEGHPIDAITSLAYLVEVRHFKDGLRFLLRRAGGKPTEAIHGLATGIKAIARHHVKVPAAQLQELQRICKKLDLELDGLREKTRRRLQQFDDEQNVGLLLGLPWKLLNLAKNPRVPRRRAAVLVQLAVIIELSLFAPLRVGNLARLSLERHLEWARTSRGDVLHIFIPAEETKNRRPIHHELSGETAKLVRLYITKYRPLLVNQPSEWLFPGRDGNPKNPTGLSLQISRTIQRHTGLDVNIHLFRHLVGKFHLGRHPGDYETIRQVLGHASIETTTQAYTQFEARSALLHYQETVRLLREHLPLDLKPRRGRRNRKNEDA